MPCIAPVLRFGNPAINKVLVVEKNIPGMTIERFDIIDLVFSVFPVCKLIGGAAVTPWTLHMVIRTQAIIHSKDAQNVPLCGRAGVASNRWLNLSQGRWMRSARLLRLSRARYDVQLFA